MRKRAPAPVASRLREKNRAGARDACLDQALDRARRGDFEGGLSGLFESAGLVCPPLMQLGIRFDPARHIENRAKPEDAEGAAVEGGLRAALARLDATKRRPTEYWCLRAAVEMLFARPDKALAAAERAARMDPDWAWGFLWSARARGAQLVSRRQARLLEAIPALAPELRIILSLYRRAESLDPENRDVYAWRAQFLNSLDQEEASIPDLKKVLELDPSYGWAYSLLADAFSEHRRVDESLAVCRAMFKRFSKVGWAYAYRGRERGKAGMFRPALVDLKRAMRLDANLSGLEAWIGEMVRQRGDYAGALVWMDRALEIAPCNYNFHVWRARLLNALGRVDEALEGLRRAALARKYPDEHFYLVRGESLLKRGRFAESAADFDRAFPASPATLWSPRLTNGRRDPIGEGSSALFADIERAAAEHPGDAWPLAFRGLVSSQKESGGGLDSGWRDLDQAVRLSPQNAWARRWRARALLTTGRTQDAFMEMDLSLTLKRDDAAFWAWSGVLRFDGGDLRRAEHDFTRALRLGPGLGGFYFYRGRIRCLQGYWLDGAEDLEEGFLRGPRTSEWVSWRKEARDRAVDAAQAAEAAA